VGKSTVAKLLAKRLRLLYVDTGATYRALAYELLTRGLDPRRETDVARVARALNVRLGQSATNGFTVLLNRRDVSRIIRTEVVTEVAAIIAQHPRVRAELVRVQRRLAHGARAVVEGRDTGTVVFPRAPYKFFLTANATVRAARRHAELSAIQGHAPSLSILQRQLARRDRLDRRRAVGPLRTPAGAMTLDTSALTADEVVERILAALPALAKKSLRVDGKSAILALPRESRSQGWRISPARSGKPYNPSRSDGSTG